MFLYHERKMIELAERLGLPLAYVTSMDIDADPHLLDGASALYHRGPRRVLDAAGAGARHGGPQRGMNIAFLGANMMFRRTRMASTRLGERRLVICYKTSYLQDPMYGKDNTLVTSDWREPPNPDPESSLTGTLYESNPTDADFVVASPDSWLFAGTGVRKGSQVHRPGGHRVRPGQPGLPGAAADRGPLPLAADLPRREQLRRLGLLHAQRRGRGVEHRHDALGGLLQRTCGCSA